MKNATVLLILSLLAAMVSPLFAQGRSEEAMTLWAVVFNRPDLCSGGVCNEDDFNDPATPEIAVVYVGGARVPANGNVSFAGAYAEGQTFGALPFADKTVYDVDTAEIHLIVRNHGTFVPGLADDQITTFDGGCMGNCEDIQFAVFKSENADASGKSTTTVHRFSTEAVVPGAWASLMRDGDGFRAVLHTKAR